LAKSPSLNSQDKKRQCAKLTGYRDQLDWPLLAYFVEKLVVNGEMVSAVCAGDIR
jgi:hypothetical protein